MLSNGLYPIQGLSVAQLDEIDQLAAQCNAHDGGALRLNRDMLATRRGNTTNDFLCYADGLLVGFLPLFTYDPVESEVSGMVHPDYRRRGIFTALWQAARHECAARGIERLFIMVERTSTTGKAFVNAQGATLHHSEYLMTLAAPQPIQVAHPQLALRLATAADVPAIVLILAEAFHHPAEGPVQFEEERMRNPRSQWYAASDGGPVLATIGLHLYDGEAFIYGFAVDPAQQGHGYGRQILGQIVALALAAHPQRVMLEVETQNAHALGLYTSCGFEQTTVYDYYRIAFN